MLYLVATPIGNLADFSFRAVEVLSSCDLILCEDTRTSLALLRHYEIHRPLNSYHIFNEKSKEADLISRLQQGQSIALLSDGGCPAICDPGGRLIDTCIKNDLPFTVIPGPSALLQALLVSGLPIIPFQFLGFLPKKESAVLSLLPHIFSFPGTTVVYEAPHRLLKTLIHMAQTAPQCDVVIARELTKKFEEVIRLSAEAAVQYFSIHPPKGEIVLLVKGGRDFFSDQQPYDLVKTLQETYRLSLTEAIKTAAHLLHLPKQQIYSQFHKKS